MHGTQGKRLDRVTGTWLPEAEWLRITADREERAFQRRSSQGQLCAPAVIGDGMPAVMSMTNGRHYDSKSQMRREYRRAGVDEVGNDVPMTKPKSDRKKRKADIKAALYRAHSRVGLGAP